MSANTYHCVVGHGMSHPGTAFHALTTLHFRNGWMCTRDVLCVQGLELAVPGTYIAGEAVVTIAAFAPQLHVITSKQRPRKLTIHGSDGAEYMFLLKACCA